MTDANVSAENHSPQTEALENRLTQKDKVDVLMRKYALLKQEIINTDTAYKTHLLRFMFFLPATVALVTYLTRNESFAKQMQFATLLNSRGFWIAITYLAIFIVSYRVFDLIECQYKIIALGARLHSLEKTINKRAGERLLIWETSLANAFFGELFRPSVEKETLLRKILNPKKWNPDIFLTTYVGIIVFISILGPPIYAIQFWDNNQGYALLFKVLLVGGFVCAFGAIILMGLVVKGVLLEMRGEAQKFALKEAEKPWSDK